MSKGRRAEGEGGRGVSSLSESHSDVGSAVACLRRQAGEEAVPGVPGTAARPPGADVPPPGVGVPVDEHHEDLAILATRVEEVGVAVCDERTVLSVRLTVEEVRQNDAQLVGLEDVTLRERVSDGLVVRRLREPEGRKVDALGKRNRVTRDRQYPIDEVVPDVETRPCRVVLPGGSTCEGSDGDLLERCENRLLGDLELHPVGEDRADDVFAAELLHQCVELSHRKVLCCELEFAHGVSLGFIAQVSVPLPRDKGYNHYGYSYKASKSRGLIAIAIC